MECPKCKSSTKIIESRDLRKYVRRRRECLVCHKRFTTIEKMYNKNKNKNKNKNIEFVYINGKKNIKYFNTFLVEGTKEYDDYMNGNI